VHDTFPKHKHFKWQEGYGAFGVSISHVEGTVAYIKRQQEHHKVKTFQDEYIAFLEKHEIEYDDKYVWG